MADASTVMGSKGSPPRQIEGYLTARNSCLCPKISSRKYYCVLIGNLLICYESEKSYSHKQNAKVQIDLEMVCSISETVILPPNRKKSEFCFKLVFDNDTELDLSAKSREEVKNWVEGLQQSKEFFEYSKWRDDQKQQHAAQQYLYDINKAKDLNETEDTIEEIDPSLTKVSIIMSHGATYYAHVKPDADVDDLWFAVLKRLPGHFCFECVTCQLRRSTMELWSVDSHGAAYKIDQNCSLTSPHNQIYLLEHNFKLLVVHFEDLSFLICPVDISTKEKEIREMELFKRKLNQIECQDAQVYLETASKTVIPFSPNDKPLRKFWEQHGSEWSLKIRKGEKLILKSKALPKIDPRNIAQKTQEGRLNRAMKERNEMKALKKIENQKCKTSKLKAVLKHRRLSTDQPIEPADTTSLLFEEQHFGPTHSSPKHPVVPCKFETLPKTRVSGQLNAPLVFEGGSDVELPGTGSDQLDFVKMPSGSDADLLSTESEHPDFIKMPGGSDVDLTGTGSDPPRNERRSTEGDTGRELERSNYERRRQSDSSTLTRHGATRRKKDGGKKQKKKSVLKKSNSDRSRAKAHDKHVIIILPDDHEENVHVTRGDHVTCNDVYVTGNDDHVTFDDDHVTCDDNHVFNSQPDKTPMTNVSRDDHMTNFPRDEKQEETTENSESRHVTEVKSRTVTQEIPLQKTSQRDSGLLEEEVKALDVALLEHNDVTVIQSVTQDPQLQATTVTDDSDESSSHSSSSLSSITSSPESSDETEHEFFPDDSVGKPVGFHHCEYAIKSPYILKDILEQYARLRVDEEEVGGILPPSVICLSSVHLQHCNGFWTFCDETITSEENVDTENCEVFQLPGDIRVLFNRSKRTWTVQRTHEDNPDITCKTIGSPLPQSANEDPYSIDDCPTTFPPMTINHCGQHFSPLDSDDPYLDNHVITPSQSSSNSQVFPEVKILEDAVQKLFYYIEKKQVIPEECLDDLKYPDVRRLVCVELCSALNAVLKNGLKKRWTLLGSTRFSVWDATSGVNLSGDVTAIVKRINTLGSIEDSTRFEVFVCECVNKGLLGVWAEALMRNRKKLGSFYEDYSLVLSLEKCKLELVLSRLDYLPFNLTYFEFVENILKKQGQAMFICE